MRVEHREADGREQRAGNAKQGAEQDQRQAAPGERAEKRQQQESAGAPEIDTPQPQEIAERTAEQYEGREREVIAIHHPLQAGKGHLQGFADAGQRQRHHAFAQHDHAASRD